MHRRPAARRWAASRDGATSSAGESKDADTVAFEKDFSDALGLTVEVRRGSGESGYLCIRYGNYEQLDYVRNRLLGMYS